MKTLEDILMVHPVSNATAVAAGQPTTVRAASPTPPAPKPQPAATDTVQISAASKALQELSETSVQTGQEARSGDVQAQRLLAKEEAAQGNAK
jgi:hypothetical protein